MDWHDPANPRKLAFKECQLKEVLSWLSGFPIIDGKRWLAEEEVRRQEEARWDKLRIMREEAEWWARGNSHAEAVWNETESRIRSDPEFRDRYAKKVREAKNDYVKDAKSCPNCGSAPDELAWFRYSARPSTDAHSCERDSWITFCDKCHEEVDFFSRWFHTGPENEPMSPPEETFPEDPEICPIHIRALIRGKARVRYGHSDIPEEEVDADTWLFPYARSFVLGGRGLCFDVKEEAVRYCPKCRRAEQEWIRSRHESWPDLI